MARNTIDSLNCSIADTLNLIGEWWTILILREAFFGSRRFEEFQQHLGIARNILTARLNKLCESGILKRVPVKEGARRNEYRLTAMGRDLLPILLVLTHWGDRWLNESEGAPVIFVERETGERIPDIRTLSQDGRELEAHDLALIPGPGATEATKERLRQMAETWANRQKKSQDD